MSILVYIIAAWVFGAVAGGCFLSAVIAYRDRQVPRGNPDEQYVGPWPAYLYTRDDDQ